MWSWGGGSVLRPKTSRLLTTPSDLAPMSTRISSLSMRTTVPSTTSPCLKLRISPLCSLSSSSIVVGSGPRARGAGGGAAGGRAFAKRLQDGGFDDLGGGGGLVGDGSRDALIASWHLGGVHLRLRLGPGLLLSRQAHGLLRSNCIRETI